MLTADCWLLGAPDCCELLLAASCWRLTAADFRLMAAVGGRANVELCGTENSPAFRTWKWERGVVAFGIFFSFLPLPIFKDIKVTHWN